MINVTEEKNTYLSSFAEFRQSDAARSSPWLEGIRRTAIGRFSELGFPSMRLEEWKYTSVNPIARVPFVPAPGRSNGITASDLARFTFSEMECCQLVFIDGRYSHSLSTPKSLPRGVRVKNLASALASDRELLEPHLARHAAYDQNAFAALNTAFMADGAFIYVPQGTVLKEMIHLLFLSTGDGEPTVSHPRNLVVLGAGSQAIVVESYVGLNQGQYFTNAVSEIVAGSDCVLDHTKLQRESDRAFHVATLQFHQDRNSNVTSHSISLGGSLVRNDLNLVLDAEGCQALLNGLYLTKGTQHIDNHTRIDHAKPHCESRELYKGILDDRSTGVFNGKILVRQNAQKTNAKQTNKNLLLSEEALVNTTPQLEIFADDVKCTHGATIGRLNEDELFYMRSRGIGEESARTLLTYAFASDILGAMKLKPIQCQIDLVLLNRLARAKEIQ
jgi:Fe-S cluster assembly protein SufD